MGLLSALGQRGMRSLRSGQMFGRGPMSGADEMAEAMARQGDLANMTPTAIPMLKQKLASGQALTPEELHLATRIPEYLSPQEKMALETALDGLHAGGGRAYPVQFGNAPIPGQ